MPITKDEFISMDENRIPFKDVEIGDLDFGGETIHLRSAFAGAKFMGNVSFKGSITFGSNENFKGAKFYGENVSFENASFDSKEFQSNNNIDFSNTQFADNSIVSFKNAKFLNDGVLNFSGADFNSAKIVDFSLAEFRSAGGTKFNACNFEKVEDVSFRRAKFFGKGIVSFTITAFNTNGLLKFNYVYIEYPRYMEFIDTNLSKALLLRTDLINIKFRRVHFFSPGGNELYDAIKWGEDYRNEISKLRETEKIKPLDISARYAQLKKIFELRETKKKVLDHIRVLYTQLKQNYESVRDFTHAGEFHVGEMEMRRKQYKFINQYISILNFYRILSNYGQSWKRAVMVFLVGTFLFTILNLLYLEWPHSDVWLGNNFVQIFYGFADSWISTLDIIFPGRIIGTGYLTMENLKVFSKFLLLIESIFGPLMLAMIILAVRRHTKR